ncbi:type IV pilus biogenesis/stability protein PilW [Sinimarinibacterium sp. CAU 1509]|uniref:type IV pilus biogenesis/stability protein PilW n=1 Tax=Sinimarinibacterium sp. CAU 1509 TaxID=2562283 RepID=UPI0010ABFB77|nr:type IV pilus biogenesis/stability protein PilW [Sinimarinibacterium sp. CAU 1509]TJY61976.1 type IV pilus biogenesis/stability protein PilW [Sinimarinibacterium sp. CAU 1509]
MRRMGLLVVAALTVALGVAGCTSAAKRAENESEARSVAEQGIAYAQRGEYDQALTKLKRALWLDSTLTPAHAGIALVYSNTGKPDKAEKHYRKALSLSPADPVLKNNFGVFMCGQGRVEDGEQLLVEAANDKRYPTPAAAWTNAGTCVKAKDLEKAEQYLRKALQIDPDNREALAQMALVSYSRKDYLRARAFLQRYGVEEAPTAELLDIAVRSERELGDLDASRRYERLLKLKFPEFSEPVSSSQSQ